MNCFHDSNVNAIPRGGKSRASRRLRHLLLRLCLAPLALCKRPVPLLRQGARLPQLFLVDRHRLVRLKREARALVTGPSGRKQPVTRPCPPARAEDLHVRDAAECLEQSHSICRKHRNGQVWTKGWRVSVLTPHPRLWASRRTASGKTSTKRWSCHQGRRPQTSPRRARSASPP